MHNGVAPITGSLGLVSPSSENMFESFRMVYWRKVRGCWKMCNLLAEYKKSSHFSHRESSGSLRLRSFAGWCIRVGMVELHGAIIPMGLCCGMFAGQAFEHSIAEQEEDRLAPLSRVDQSSLLTSILFPHLYWGLATSSFSTSSSQ